MLLGQMDGRRIEMWSLVEILTWNEFYQTNKKTRFFYVFILSKKTSFSVVQKTLSGSHKF